MPRFLYTIALLSLMLSGCADLKPQASPDSGSSVGQKPTPTPAATEDRISSRQEASRSPHTGQTTAIKPRPLDTIDFDDVMIEADLSDQVVYVKQDGEIVRQMPTSSGIDTAPENSTPRGEFEIEAERGDWFYAPQYEEGAKYWVSFKNHGEFLFHSVVMDAHEQVIPAEARKLGTKASHGCFRLQVEDAKWIYDHIKTGTKVVIHE
ncbi:MAG TPA: L,D-transpeptidase [Bacilli bacterium]|nr:L,D-transpeptidase [Bacilli bacterium]